MRYKSVTYVSDVYSFFYLPYADYMLKEILLIFISWILKKAMWLWKS